MLLQSGRSDVLQSLPVNQPSDPDHLIIHFNAWLTVTAELDTHNNSSSMEQSPS